jgi:hypothetical protein
MFLFHYLKLELLSPYKDQVIGWTQEKLCFKLSAEVGRYS